MLEAETRKEFLGLNGKDYLLFLALERLKNDWNNEGVGIVSAALLDTGGLVTATSSYDKSLERWNHAERNVVEEYTQKAGALPSGNAAMAVSLSPCVSEESETRSGISCAERLTQLGIKNVHFGAVDTKQSEIADLNSFGINATQTSNIIMRELSESIYGLFDKRPYDRNDIDFSTLKVIKRY